MSAQTLQELIGRRALELSQRRPRSGGIGDEISDWLQAERELVIHAVPGCCDAVRPPDNQAIVQMPPEPIRLDVPEERGLAGAILHHYLGFFVVAPLDLPDIPQHRYENFSIQASMTPPAPPPIFIVTLTPANAFATEAPFTLVVWGPNDRMNPDCQVTIGAVTQPTTFVDVNSVQVDNLDPGTLGLAGVYAVHVVEGPTFSNALNFTLNPGISSISPGSGNTAPFTLTVNGKGFNPTAQIQFHGVLQTTTYVDATKLTCVISALPAPGTTGVYVFDGSLISNGVPFTVTPPPPAITSLAPNTGTIGSSFPVTVTGTNFVNGAVVSVGYDKGTTFNSATSLTFSIFPADTGVAQTLHVTVRNPDGQVSNSMSITIA